MENQKETNLLKMSDAKLVGLLYSEGDRLPREVVDEITRRGEQMIDFLAEIIENVSNWNADDDRSWSPIHATHILGAIGGEYIISPLFMSLRFADAFEVDWLWEVFPAVFGKIGMKAIEPLKNFALDKSNTSFCRGIALESLGAAALKDKNQERELLDFVARFLKDGCENMELRGIAGNILLDFGERRYEKSLLEFAEDEKEMRENDPFYVHTFDADDIEKYFERDEKNLERYSRDWLDFYNEEEIAKRQKRWKKENSWRGKLESFWLKRKIN